VDYELIKPDETHDAGAFMSYARQRRTDKQQRDPDVGDTVHFWDMVDAKCRAAMVGDINGPLGGPGLADLAVLNFDLDKGLHWGQELDVAHDETKTGPSWHWPCGGH
jgi:hypothetical protein